MKVDLEIVEDTLRQNKQLGDAEVTALLDRIKNEAEARKLPREKKPRRPHVLLISDPDNKLQGVELTGWVFQTEPEEEFSDLSAVLQRVAGSFNASPKGRKNPVETFGDTIMYAPAKLFREEGLSRKHKEPAFVRTVPNRLPVVRELEAD